LCGLNCGLCPRYATEGESKCPGCGGNDFYLKHPTCAVITCNKKHENVEFCFQCSSYPCERYRKQSTIDSFITYRNVQKDFSKAAADINNYKSELNEKVKVLEFLIKHYNDGRRKNFYCIAVNLISLDDLKSLMDRICRKIDGQGLELKEKIKIVMGEFNDIAEKKGIDLKLRK
jgi:hypothetical protein